MVRVEVVNRIIEQIGGRGYLEIGVKRGGTFMRISADRKIGVDPVWPNLKMLIYLLKNANVKYYRMKSDKFFRKYSMKLAKSNIDVVLIDGWHEYHQSLRDVENCLKFMPDNGVIVVHDCNPQSELAAVSPMADKMAGRRPGVWNGDVWKTVVRLRCCHKELNVFVLNCDQGLGIITRGLPDVELGFSEEDIENMTYEDLHGDREKLLNLKEADYFEAFLDRLREDNLKC